ncbi:uncharacterized protein KQ657_000341 [Scheffersomyces spartinae]|uniref:Transcription factor Iwr1 domain-containing protein n=1 Tax=Scheffersomyces spartinae TaxID=45513 RepID=A0A9P7V9A7_9ASCO|nr:uncharacterized protein KQ657_000341 [Scheffersomyces spartinae]KAG7193656.1 hypothetical protein KQ657_000341 [Scheffersomyces spartinae]
MSAQPPQFLRIKRKRGQDPLQGLVLEDKRSAKRSKPSTPLGSPKASYTDIGALRGVKETTNFYFKLARTDDVHVHVDGSDGGDVIPSVLSETTTTGDNSRKRKFVIPNNQTAEDTLIPNELSDMLDSFLTINSSEPPQEKRISRGRKVVEEGVKNQSPPGPTPIHVPLGGEDPEGDSEYVYDVYQLTTTEPRTSANHPQSQIGYVRFFDDSDNELYQSEDDKDLNVFTDDEDSNAEDFYQNDYPSDEDANINSNEVFSQSNQFEAELESGDNALGDNSEDEDEYEHLFAKYGGGEGDHTVNFLQDVAGNDTDEEEQEEVEEGEQYERKIFFKSDKDNELAIYRDQIFGKLDSMIKKKQKGV